MRVALVHDWLTGMRGGEKVLVELARLFPDAPILTLFHRRGSVSAEIEQHQIRTTFLQPITDRIHEYRVFLPLFFAAAERWDARAFDIVISSSHCVAKNIHTPPGTLHVSYSHTPARYLHDEFATYVARYPAVVRAAAELIRQPMRRWDIATSDRPDGYIANSENVRERIRTLYGVDATVVHPPVDVSRFTPPVEPRREGFLIVSALVPYKRLETAIDAANTARLPLTIAGGGPDERRLRERAGATIRFLGRVTDDELARLYQTASALLMPGVEDFGIVPLEAQASGLPVIARGRGGATETVIDGVTGVLYGEDDPAALIDAIRRFETLTFDEQRLHEHARSFVPERFRREFLAAAIAIAEASGKRAAADYLRDIQANDGRAA
jgi:glycosyltransferase involved in cell wall biosynthesis